MPKASKGESALEEWGPVTSGPFVTEMEPQTPEATPNFQESLEPAPEASVTDPHPRGYQELTPQADP